MSNGNELATLLQLDAISAGSMTFTEFLSTLKEHPENADSAAALLVRAVKSKGLVDIEQAEPERRPYLRMVRSMGIPAYTAFDHVRGSQRTVAIIMKHYEAAAHNGYQLRQMLTIIGGPGSGKSFLVDALAAVLEGQVVYAVKGCPLHENPINLLKLLPPAALEQLIGKLGDHVRELMKSALEPCAHCFRSLMYDGDEPRKEPNLGDITVNMLRLSSRDSGISVWTPSTQGCSLSTALRQGSRGLVRLPEAFSQKGVQPGKVSELQILLEATEGRRIPGSATDHCATATGYCPFDGLIVAETNKGAWDAFLKDQPDQDAFTRRNRIMTVPYNTVLSEEVQAYRDFTKQLRSIPHMDPFALKLAATLAVATRMAEKDSQGNTIEPDLITRMRMYDGERLSIPKKQPASSGYGNYGSGFGGYGQSPKPASSEAEAKVQVADLWKVTSDEGSFGLNMGFMLSSVSQVAELAMSAPAHTHKGKGPCVSSLSMLAYLRNRIKSWANSSRTASSTTKAEDRVIERCLEYLKEIESLDSLPGLVEKEYRRLLRAQLLQVFAPDYDERATEDFDRYCRHAEAWAQGKTKVFDPRHRTEVPVAEAFLDEVDRAQGLTSREEREKFRSSLNARIAQLVRAQSLRPEEGEEEDKVTISWQTIPELAKAIKARLDADIAKKVERILTKQVPDLTEDEQAMHKESVVRLTEAGYCDSCREQALNYARDHKLWVSQG